MRLRLVSLLALLLLPSASASAARTESVQSSRAAALQAMQRGWEREVMPRPCGLWNPDTKTSRLSFPAGRFDLLLLETSARAFAFRVGGSRATLVWCGAFAQPGQQASSLRGSAARALAFAYRTGWDAFPREAAAFDTYTELAQQLTVTAGQPRNGRRCAHTYNLIGYGLSFPSADLLRFSCGGETVVHRSRH